MTKKTITALKSEINTNLADNNTGDIGASDVRNALLNTIDSLAGISGWATYVDTDYTTSGTALTVLANTDTILPNNAGSKNETYMPVDITGYYAPQSLAYDGGSSLFVAGETVEGASSGATADIVDLSGDATSGILFLENVSGTFSDNETITSSSGSALANGTLAGGRILGREGDSLDLMMYFKAVPSAVSQWVDVWIDIGGGIGELYRQTFTFPKGAGTERGIVWSMPAAYTLNTWEANGGGVYIRSDADLDIYDINFNFDRCFKAL